MIQQFTIGEFLGQGDNPAEGVGQQAPDRLNNARFDVAGGYRAFAQIQSSTAPTQSNIVLRTNRYDHKGFMLATGVQATPSTEFRNYVLTVTDSGRVDVQSSNLSLFTFDLVQGAGAYYDQNNFLVRDIDGTWRTAENTYPVDYSATSATSEPTTEPSGLEDFHRMAYGEDGAGNRRLVLVGDAGASYYSDDDGDTWSPTTTSLSGNLFAVYWVPWANSGNGLWFIGGASNNVWSSTDGDNWTSETGPFTSNGIIRDFVDDGSTFVMAVGQNTSSGTPAASTSDPDTISWTAQTVNTSLSSAIGRVRYQEGVFAAACYNSTFILGEIVVSNDGGSTFDVVRATDGGYTDVAYADGTWAFAVTTTSPNIPRVEYTSDLDGAYSIGSRPEGAYTGGPINPQHMNLDWSGSFWFIYTQYDNSTDIDEDAYYATDLADWRNLNVGTGLLPTRTTANFPNAIGVNADATPARVVFASDDDTADNAMFILQGLPLTTGYYAFAAILSVETDSGKVVRDIDTFRLDNSGGGFAVTFTPDSTMPSTYRVDIYVEYDDTAAPDNPAYQLLRTLRAGEVYSVTPAITDIVTPIIGSNGALNIAVDFGNEAELHLARVWWPVGSDKSYDVFNTDADVGREGGPFTLAYSEQGFVNLLGITNFLEIEPGQSSSVTDVASGPGQNLYVFFQNEIFSVYGDPAFADTTRVENFGVRRISEGIGHNVDSRVAKVGGLLACIHNGQIYLITGQQGPQRISDPVA